KSWGVYQYARKEVTVRELELKIAERELTLRVLEAFERVLLNESRVKALTDMNTIQQKMVVISGSRYGVGREGRLDLLQAKTGLAMLTPALLQARNQLKISTLELAVLIKYPSPQALELQGALEVPAWEELLTKKSVLTEESPLEVQAANLRYLQVTDRKTVARSKLLPHLDGFASYGSLSTTVGHIFSSPSETWALGVALKLPISAALSWAYEDRALDAELAERDFDQTNLRQNWLVDRYRLEKELEFSKSVLEASKSALDQAHEALQYADVTYQIGKTSFLQYYQAQKNLLDTTIALSQARFDTFQTLARYFSVTGLPLQDLVTAAEAAGVRH
ncbi:MAG: TolC family protein, partial [Bdellovibrionota bacterium]